ncbi:hypothetical protein BC940DRAFT_47305 [Gongronella butleri]|nr:hypothetical protein BC940DRAFT_47305 [Gongronella butleri]
MGFFFFRRRDKNKRSVLTQGSSVATTSFAPDRVVSSSSAIMPEQRDKWALFSSSNQFKYGTSLMDEIMKELLPHADNPAKQPCSPSARPTRSSLALSSPMPHRAISSPPNPATEDMLLESPGASSITHNGNGQEMDVKIRKKKEEKRKKEQKSANDLTRAHPHFFFCVSFFSPLVRRSMIMPKSQHPLNIGTNYCCVMRTWPHRRRFHRCRNAWSTN